ncbi:hypothetical protein [Williamsia sp. CHRR-6]|uniref:hypothetical protein n=1 Tax=Williamsia sp. CHRR-6 TaxID=2835871 RepID=UPI001BD9C118|nr:hypothetical protein [Williamsia sp. CHRR-6]MBT0567163.1 hypothetical protein [Williamsia sp. CHRR-6]
MTAALSISSASVDHTTHDPTAKITVVEGEPASDARVLSAGAAGPFVGFIAGVVQGVAAVAELFESSGKTVDRQRGHLIGFGAVEELLDLVAVDAHLIDLVFHALHHQCEEHQHCREEQYCKSVHDPGVNTTIVSASSRTAAP